MRKSNKAALADYLFTSKATVAPKRKSSSKPIQKSSKKAKLPNGVDSQKGGTTEEAEQSNGNTEDLRIMKTMPDSSYFVLDGGALLHRVT